MAKARGKVEIVLSCKHVQLYEVGIPRYGDDVWCRYCQDYVTAIGPIANYSFRCSQCTAGRSYGGDRDSCERAAGRHVLTRPHHLVTIWHGQTKITTIGQDERASELPLEGVATRRSEQAKQHQKVLREFLVNRERS